MSWAEIKKALNSELSVPLNEQLNRQYGKVAFTENGSFVVPDGVSVIKVMLVGAGGAGSRGSNKAAGSGGLGGQVLVAEIIVQPNTTLGITVGTGNTIVTNNSDISLTALAASVNGPGFDLYNSKQGTDGDSGLWGYGGKPGTGIGSQGGAGGAGNGGNSLSASDAKGKDAQGYGNGGGGGGGKNASPTSSEGGAGSPGIVIIEW